MNPGEIVALVIAVIAIALADLRWWRVAQREHYLGGAVSLFVRRWWYRDTRNLVLWVVGLLAFVASVIFPSLLVVPALVVAVAPLGLSPKGRSSKLAWTKRMKRLAFATVGLQVIALALISSLTGIPAATAVVLALIVPTFVELALLITRPYERKQTGKFVEQAKKRLAQVSPKVVAITGSYGKTSTKAAVAHLLAARNTVVASPASFNNRAGLSRTLNEQLVPGTDVLVAEMGTYGPGEIAELCDICPPDISVFTAIGPVHLERFGSESAIIAAKAEIFENAGIAVINVDDDRLAHLADRLGEDGKKVWRCGSTSDAAGVRVTDRGDVIVDDEMVAQGVALTTAPGNAACAIAVALECGIESETIVERLAGVPSVAHRREVTKNEAGVTVIDDTYNLNPAGARLALHRLAETDAQRRILVTPGMVELGRRQAEENKAFAAMAGEIATDIIVVGNTNRQALRDGAAGKAARVRHVPNLAKAVEWVRAEAREGDAVLYANDLPDHYS